MELKMKKKKVLNLLIVFVFAISLILSTTVTASAATVKINKTKATITIGSSATVKILNTTKKVTWTSSNKSIATVTSKGKVTGKSEGIVTIKGKVGGKTYKCKVTVKTPWGSRKYPADPTLGVTIKTSSGTMYYKINNMVLGTAAEDLFKQIDAESWSFNQKYDSEDFIDKQLVGIEFYVSAKSGYEEYALSGYSIISPFSIYNSELNATLSDCDTLYFNSTETYKSYSDIELYNGGSSNMYVFLLIPDDVTAFSTYEYTNKFEKYWVKYDLSKVNSAE